MYPDVEGEARSEELDDDFLELELDGPFPEDELDFGLLVVVVLALFGGLVLSLEAVAGLELSPENEEVCFDAVEDLPMVMVEVTVEAPTALDELQPSEAEEVGTS